MELQINPFLFHAGDILIMCATTVAVSYIIRPVALEIINLFRQKSSQAVSTVKVEPEAAIKDPEEFDKDNVEHLKRLFAQRVSNAS